MSPLNNSRSGRKIQALIDKHVHEVVSPEVCDDPMVSVIMLTYNHSAFLSEAIESAEMQKTDFPVELLIADDCSTDGTTARIEEHQRKYPEKVRLLLADRNMFVPTPDVHVCVIYMAALMEARGKYIAFLDADDYWTDPEKLQIQVDALENDATLAGSFHNSIVVDGNGAILDPLYFKFDAPRYSQHDCLATLVSQEATGSLMFRTSCLDPIPERYAMRPSDQYLDLLITEHGDLGYIPRNMSAYRKHGAGVWSRLDSKAQVLELWFRYKLLLGFSNFAEKHHEIIEERIASFEQMLLTHEDLERLEQEAREKKRRRKNPFSRLARRLKG